MLITSNENCEGHHNLTHIFALGVHIAEHHLQTNQGIDWDSAEYVTYNMDYPQQITLESWFTNLEQMPLNRC